MIFVIFTSKWAFAINCFLAFLSQVQTECKRERKTKWPNLEWTFTDSIQVPQQNLNRISTFHTNPMWSLEKNPKHIKILRYLFNLLSWSLWRAIQQKKMVSLHIRYDSRFEKFTSLTRVSETERSDIRMNVPKLNERRCNTWRSHMIINIVACFHLPLKELCTRKWYAPLAERTVVVRHTCMKKLSR